jgi:hypothetical protein
MHSSERDVLAAECRSFSLYLMNQLPDAYVVEKYCTAHAAGNILDSPHCNAFDAALVRLAPRNRFFTRLIDLYTSLFFKRALVRRKLVLLLAILESAAPSYAYFDSTDGLGPFAFCWMALRRGFVFLVVLMLSLVSLLPLHLGLRARGEHGVRGARSNGRPAPEA